MAEIIGHNILANLFSFAEQEVEQMMLLKYEVQTRLDTRKCNLKTVQWKEAEHYSNWLDYPCFRCGSHKDCLWRVHRNETLTDLLAFEMIEESPRKVPTLTPLTKSDIRQMLYRKICIRINGPMSHGVPLPNCIMAGVRGLSPNEVLVPAVGVVDDEEYTGYHSQTEW